MAEKFSFSESNQLNNRLDFTEKEVNTIEALGLTLEDVQKLLSEEPLAEGSYALIFDLPSDAQDLVAKVWKNPKEDSQRAERENVVLRLLRLRKFDHMPRLAGYLPHSTILFESKINGSQVEQYDEKTIKQLAFSLSGLHSIRLNSYGRPLSHRKEGTLLDCYHDNVNGLREIAAQFNDENDLDLLIKQAIDKLDYETGDKKQAFSGSDFTLIHFDLNPNNILRSNDEDKIVIIDWEQASAGDNAMDIAKCFFKLNFNEKQKEIFLAEYKKGLPREDAHFQERLAAYELFVLVNSILWRLRVLRDMPQQMSSDNEAQFYNRVKVNLDSEVEMLKNFVLE